LIEVPEAFEIRRIRSAGDSGEAWVRSLPSVVVELENLWGLRIDGEVMHGEVGLVVPVDRSGEPLILKVSYPDRESVHEAAALRAWNGQGTVRLIEHDKQRNAVLIERLDSARPLEHAPRDEAIDVAASLLRRLTAPPVAGPRSLVDVVDQHTVFFDRMPPEVPADLVNFAQQWLEAYCPSGNEQLINADLHYGNVLAGTREPWLAIDPKPIVGEPEYGVAPLLWNLTPQELSSSLMTIFDRIVEVAELDDERALQWTVVRTIDYWLWAWNTGLTNEPVKCKHIAQTLIAQRV
jgi:streptomycin 6-kinase